MSVDRGYVAQNEEQLTRMRNLVDTLSDEELAAPMEAGWTVASVLGHLAFWDYRIVALVDRWGSDGEGTQPDAPGSYDEEAVDWINDAGKPLLRAMPPRVAAQAAVDAAGEADRRVADLSDDLWATNERTGNYINPLRADHRREHLDEIDQARSRR
ncbi:MAG: maleylpyruvate isomerase N-terminal domain-containing protein [Actinobacteria bacterium]|nr:maleylpyruvate isomerase N-terminal domain-containing protein [Actinomycetota bacterium]